MLFISESSQSNNCDCEQWHEQGQEHEQDYEYGHEHGHDVMVTMFV